MLIKVLGAAAGGGFPQWNCNGRDERGRPPRQAGLAGADAVVAGRLAAMASDWVLLNASPDLRQQINDTPELWPAADGPLRNSPIKAVVLTNGDVDHIIGLINLREGQPFSIYGSDRVLATSTPTPCSMCCNPEKSCRASRLQLDTPTPLSRCRRRISA